MAAVLDTTVYCSSQQSRWRCARCGDDATTFVATVQQAFVLAMAQPDNKAAVASYDTLLNGLLHFGEHNMRRCVLQRSPNTKSLCSMCGFSIAACCTSFCRHTKLAIAIAEQFLHQLDFQGMRPDSRLWRRFLPEFVEDLEDCVADLEDDALSEDARAEFHRFVRCCNTFLSQT